MGGKYILASSLYSCDKKWKKNIHPELLDMDTQFAQFPKCHSSGYCTTHEGLKGKSLMILERIVTQSRLGFNQENIVRSQLARSNQILTFDVSSPFPKRRIISFGSKETKKIWEGVRIRKLPVELQETGRRKLRMLNNSHSTADLKVPPSNRLEKLKGNFKDYYSIRINDRWRIIFKWENGNAYEVEMVDYH